MFYASGNIRSGIYLKTLYRGDTDRKIVSITFDDGPSENTAQIIEILKKELGMEGGQTRLSSIRTERSDEDSPKIIVFTQFRDTLDMIHERCEQEGIRSVRFYGQGTSDGKKGLSQKEQVPLACVI